MATNANESTVGSVVGNESLSSFKDPGMRSLASHVSSEDPMSLFEIMQPLGRGSYGIVYKARCLRSGILVAVKQISLEQREGDVDDVRQEIEILQDCHHPNIVNYRGSYIRDEVLWIVMEYCGAGSIADIIKGGGVPLEEREIAVICRESLKGLVYLHHLNKIHRDIKGGNIMLTDDGAVKLADFGVSTQLSHTLSKRNTFIGTPYWMSPEVIQESAYDGRADVWALGITAIEMSEMAPPHSDGHPMRVLFKIPRQPAPTLKEPHKWSACFRDFLRACLVKDVKRRPTAEALLHHDFVREGTPTDVLKDAISRTNRLKHERKQQQQKDEIIDHVIGAALAGEASDEDEATAPQESATMTEGFDGTVIAHGANSSRRIENSPKHKLGSQLQVEEQNYSTALTRDVQESDGEDYGTVITRPLAVPDENQEYGTVIERPVADSSSGDEGFSTTVSRPIQIGGDRCESSSSSEDSEDEGMQIAPSASSSGAAAFMQATGTGVSALNSPFSDQSASSPATTYMEASQLLADVSLTPSSPQSAFNKSDSSPVSGNFRESNKSALGKSAGRRSSSNSQAGLRMVEKLQAARQDKLRRSIQGDDNVVTAVHSRSAHALARPILSPTNAKRAPSFGEFVGFVDNDPRGRAQEKLQRILQRNGMVTVPFFDPPRDYGVSICQPLSAEDKANARLLQNQFGFTSANESEESEGRDAGNQQPTGARANLLAFCAKLETGTAGSGLRAEERDNLSKQARQILQAIS